MIKTAVKRGLCNILLLGLCILSTLSHLLATESSETISFSNPEQFDMRFTSVKIERKIQDGVPSDKYTVTLSGVPQV